jgi:pilus assembly protein Flp/PilA
MSQTQLAAVNLFHFKVCQLPCHKRTLLTQNNGERGGVQELDAVEPRRNQMQTIRKLIRNNKGATAIEYGLIAALIAVAAITAMSNLGGQLGNTFNRVKGNMASNS